MTEEDVGRRSRCRDGTMLDLFDPDSQLIPPALWSVYAARERRLLRLP